MLSPISHSASSLNSNSALHITFPGGKHLRSPLLALGMLWHRLKELT
nr:hypothetical protein [Pseudomonas putida]